MAEAIVIIACAVLGVGLAVARMYLSIARRKHDVRQVVEKLGADLKEKKELIAKVQELFGRMVPMEEVREKGRALKLLQESLKTERGRITITQAELETVENRLRELEEISRELEASGVETKEELNILKKKEKELTTKNENLKQQIAASMAQIDEMLTQLQLNAELAAQVEAMKADLLATQEKIDTLLLEIEQGNEQYFVLKKRYDALDIEYAQLFEKFSEAEALVAKAQ